MSNLKLNSSVKLDYSNWHLWEHYIKSTIHRKNAYVALDPKPINPRAPQVVQPAATATATAPAAATTPIITVTTVPTAEELKAYWEELKEWRAVNNVVAGVILGSISSEVEHIVDPEEPAKDMYDKLKAKILRQSSGSSAYSMWIELICKKFKETPMLENFEKHLTFYRLKNTSLKAVSAGFDNPFLAFLLLYLFNSLKDPVWSMASTNIATSDIPINQWSFNQVAGKLHEALHNTMCSTDASTSGNGQSALNATASKQPASNRYTGPPCTYLDCWRQKTHPTDKCWVKEKDKKEKEKEKEKSRKHKAKKAKRKAADSNSRSGSESDASESDSGHS